MPMFKVYLGNLDSRVTAETLQPLFQPFGDGEEIVIATDADGKSRGFAIILFKDPLKGQLAIETLANRKINGRTVVINEAVKKGKKTLPSTRMPRNTPLGPRAFPRASGFGRASGGGGPRAGAGGGGRFIRNPRRLFTQSPGSGPGEPAPGGSSPSGAPGSPMEGSGGSRPASMGQGFPSPGGAPGLSARPSAPGARPSPPPGATPFVRPSPTSAQPESSGSGGSKPPKAPASTPPGGEPEAPKPPARPRAAKKIIPPEST